MSVHVIDTIKPKNGLSFPIVEDVDILIVDSGKRLSEVVATMATQSDIEALQTAVNSKASQSDVTALQTAVAGKASAADLAALAADVDEKADTSDLTTAAANLQAQIDALVTPVTQDAEVQNARVSADGITYNTLKARLDSENTSLVESLTALSDATTEIENLLDYAVSISGKYYDGTDGQLKNGTGVISFPLIDVESSSNYYYYTNYASGTSTIFSCVLFDENKTYKRQVSLKTIRESALIATASDEKYVGITIYTANKDNCAFVTDDIADKYFVEVQSAQNVIPDHYVIKTVDNNYATKPEVQAVNTRVTAVDNRVSSLESFTTEICNIIDVDTLIDNKYYNPANGAIYDGDGSTHCTDLLPVTTGDYFLYTNTTGTQIFSFCIYDSNKAFIRAVPAVDFKTKARVSIASTEKYVGITINNAKIDNTAFISNKFAGVYLDSPQSESNVIPPHRILKSADVNGTTVSTAAELVSALTAAVGKGSESNPYIIRLKDGIYNLLPYVDTETEYETGISIPNNVHLVGSETLGALITLEVPATAPALSASWLSTLNFTGNGEIHNLRVYGNNVRYAIHDDFASAGFKRVVKNCVLAHGINTIATDEARQCGYGLGTRSGCSMLFEDTVFSGHAAGILMHDDANSCDVESNIVFRNCRFNGGNWYVLNNKTDRSAYFTGLAGATAGYQPTNISFQNCSFNKQLMHQETVAGEQSLLISGFGNNQSVSIESEITIVNV